MCGHMCDGLWVTKSQLEGRIDPTTTRRLFHGDCGRATSMPCPLDGGLLFQFPDMLRHFVLCTSLATLPQSLLAGTAPALEPPVDDASWEFTGAAGLAFTDGNSDSLAYNVRFLVSRFTEANETWLSADYHYADDDGVKSTDTLRLGIQHDHKPGGPVYVGVSGSILADPIADVDYRFDVGAHAGWHAFETESTRLSFEAGPGFTFEKSGDDRDEYASIQVAQRFEHALNPHGRISPRS